MAKKLFPFKPSSHVIRGDAFCHAIADVSDRMLAELFTIQTSFKTILARNNAIIRMIRDLKVSALDNRQTSRIYRSAVGKIFVTTQHHWFSCSSWVDQLDLPQKPDRRKARDNVRSRTGSRRRSRRPFRAGERSHVGSDQPQAR